MITVLNIKTEADYAQALERLALLMDAQAGTPEGDELDVLATLIEAYEKKQYPIETPDPIMALQFRMDQLGLTNKDLVPFLGSSAKVSEVLSGKRDLTLPMIRALNKHLGIPAEALIQEPGRLIPEDDCSIDFSRFPIADMVKRGLLAANDNAEKAMRALMESARLQTLPTTAMYRKSDGARRNAKMDSYALAAWCIYVQSEAYSRKQTVTYKKGTVTLDFMREVAKLSNSESGPKDAVEYLAKHGIILIVAPHLSNTYLDGAAMILDNGTPVIGMTIRYDRLDNFWFCLLHELAHIGRHMDENNKMLFVDDLSLVDGENDRFEKEADEWAEEALVPIAIWNKSDASLAPTVDNVIALARQVNVHPAIIAGRIRRFYKDYRKLTQLVGAKEVRKHFDRKWK